MSKYGRKSYQDWTKERAVFCAQCGIEFENIRDYEDRTTRTVVNVKTGHDKNYMAGCPRCKWQGTFITGFDIKFAFDDEHNSFVFKGDGIAQLREDQKDRGTGQLPEWSWYGNREWSKELLLLSRAYEIIRKGLRPQVKKYSVQLTRIRLEWEEPETIEEFVLDDAIREER